MVAHCRGRPQPTTWFAHWNLPCTLIRMCVRVTYLHVLQKLFYLRVLELTPPIQLLLVTSASCQNIKAVNFLVFRRETWWIAFMKIVWCMSGENPMWVMVNSHQSSPDSLKDAGTASSSPACTLLILGVSPNTAIGHHSLCNSAPTTMPE